MRKVMAWAVAGGLMVCGTGCFNIVSSKGHRIMASRQPVVLDGEVYFVDVVTGDVYRLPPGAVGSAKEFHREVVIETEEEDD